MLVPGMGPQGGELLPEAQFGSKLLSLAPLHSWNFLKIQEITWPNATQEYKKITENTKKMKTDAYLGYICYYPIGLGISQNRVSVTSLLSPNSLLGSNYISTTMEWYNIKTVPLLSLFFVST